MKLLLHKIRTQLQFLTIDQAASKKFREEIAKRIYLSDYQWKQGLKVIFSFVVNADGKIEDVKAEKSSGIQKFDDRFIYATKSLKKKWILSKVNWGYCKV